MYLSGLILHHTNRQFFPQYFQQRHTLKMWTAIDDNIGLF